MYLEVVHARKANPPESGPPIGAAGRALGATGKAVRP